MAFTLQSYAPGAAGRPLSAGPVARGGGDLGLGTVGGQIAAAGAVVERDRRFAEDEWLTSASIDLRTSAEDLRRKLGPDATREDWEAAWPGVAAPTVGSAPSDRTRRRAELDARTTGLRGSVEFGRRDEARDRRFAVETRLQQLDAVTEQYQRLLREEGAPRVPSAEGGSRLGLEAMVWEARAFGIIDRMRESGDISGATAAQMKDTFRNGGKQQLVLGEMERSMAAGGIPAGERYIKNLKDDPLITDPVERDKLEVSLLAELRRERGARGSAYSALRRQTDVAVEALLKERTPAGLEDLEARARAAGDSISLERLARAQSINTAMVSFRRMDAAERDAELERRRASVETGTDNDILDRLEKIDRAMDTAETRDIGVEGRERAAAALEGMTLTDEDEFRERAQVAGEDDVVAALDDAYAIRDRLETARVQPPAELAADIEELRAAPESYTDVELVRGLEETHQALTRGYEVAPLETANNAGVVAVPDIDWTNTQTLPQQLNARTEAVRRVREHLDRPVPTLKRSERESLSAVIEQLGPQEQISVLEPIANWNRGVPALEAIRGNDPPLGHAGAWLRDGTADGRGRALAIADGAAVMKSEKQYVPKDDAVFENLYSEYLPPMSLDALPPGWRSGLRETVRAVITRMKRDAGDTSQVATNSDVETATDIVTGGVVEYGDWKTIAPRPGMDEDTFEDWIEGLTDDDLGGAVIGSATGAGARPLTADELRSDGVLLWTGGGTYRIRFYADDGNLDSFVDVTTPDGRPAIITYAETEAPE